jgi:D-proline reductase (dithiol) PrdB
MEILETREAWQAAYRDGFLARYRQTGMLDWSIYPHPRNPAAPPGPGVDLRKSRLLLISSAGGHLPAEQQPFDAANPLGDYSARLFPLATPLDALAFAHDHYDHADVNQDRQVLVPLRHLEELVQEGTIGSLAPTVVSFMGYQPDVARVIDELIPAIVRVSQVEKASAALLVPS